MLCEELPKEENKYESDDNFLYFCGDLDDYTFDSDLIVAVKENDVKKVEKLLKNTKDLDYKNHYGNTPLNIACEKGFNEIVELLLKAGANPCLGNFDGYFPLYIACYYEKLDTIKLLLKFDSVDINQRYKNYSTCLISAIRQEKTKIIDILLEDPNIDVNKEDGHSLETPLHVACENGDLLTLDKLMKRPEINIMKTSSRGNNILHSACYFSPNLNIIKYLLEHKKLNTKSGEFMGNVVNNCGETPLMCIIRNYNRNANSKAFQMLLNDSRTNPNVQDYKGNTILHIAAINNLQIVEMLLKDKRVDLSIKNNKGKTAFDLSIWGK